MKVLCVLAGNDASARLRLEWPAGANAAEGRDVLVAGTRWTLDAVQGSDGRILAMDVPQVDVLVFQRLQNRGIVNAIPYLQEAGVAVVVDVDDDFGRVDPTNPAWEGVHPASDPDRNWQWLERACRLADLVTVTTPALAERYGSHGRVAVLPNRIPRAVTELPAVLHGHPNIGWAGRIDTHPRDLQVTGGAVADVSRARDIRFVNVGPGGCARALGIDSDREDATGLVAPGAWYETCAERIHTAIAPLADTAFNHAKSGLKLLEMSALGIPCVASPTPDNERLHGLGMGVLASTRRDWRRELGRLLDDDGWRTEVSFLSRRAAAGETIEGYGDAWWAAWEQAAAARAASAATTNRG